MKLLTTSGSRQVWFGQSLRPHQFQSPVRGEFALLLVVGDLDITSDEQWQLSECLVRAGCRYAVCFGPTSTTWDDSIDMVGVMDEVDGRETKFVMTTWHDNEPIEESVEFFAQHCHFDGWRTDQYLVHVLGGSQDLVRSVQAAVLAEFGAGHDRG